MSVDGLASLSVPAPVLMVVVALAVFAAVWIVSRAAAAFASHGIQRDPQRRFTPDQRGAILARCGHRCEHKPLLWRRCGSAATHADHVMPWSRGGATSPSNGAGLCRRHNLLKAAIVPSAWYVWRLERRRSRYFPPGVRVEVAWRFGARR